MTPILERQRGAIAIMVAVSMLVLLAVVGLAIDGGLAYLVKARLNAAVDSAALAGARAVPAGNTPAEQIASAKAAAADFFAANIPSNYLLSSPKITETKVTFSGGQATIDVTAEAPMPVSIMQIMGFSSLTPVAYAQTVRNDLDMAFVIDTSASLKPVAATVRASAKSFLNKFNVTQDRVSMIHFASGVETDYPIATSGRGFNRSSMLKKIDTLAFDGGTASMEGMYNARQQLNAIPLANRSTMRVIVFFSDGEPTGFGSYITFNNSSECANTPGIIDRSYAGLASMTSTTNDTISEDCRVWRSNNTPATRSLPAWYNARNSWLNKNDVNSREFPIVTTSPRTVTADLSVNNFQRNVERASRNLAEAVAFKARDEGIIVFTLGLGSALKEPGDFDPDTGETILRCMANSPDAPKKCQRADQQSGLYCYAATEADLTPCFSRLASAILRITK